MQYGTPDTDLLFFSLSGLLPENTLLAVHRRLNIVSLLRMEGNAPRIDTQIQITPSGTLALLAILQFYPSYCPYEHLLSRLFSLPLNQCYQIVLMAQTGGKAQTKECEEFLRSLRNIKRSLHASLRSLGLDIANIRSTGYLLKRDSRATFLSTFHTDHLAVAKHAGAVEETRPPVLGGGVGNVIRPVASSHTKVFVAYSHKDTRWLERLRVHFKPLEQIGMIELWDDSKIAVGTKWKEKLQAVIQSSAIAVLVVSADFLASDFLAEYELPKLLSRAEAEGATIMPIIVAPCLLEGSGIEVFQSINPPSKPLSEMTRSAQDGMMVKVVETVKRKLTQAKKKGEM
jgi:hypothetical protein